MRVEQRNSCSVCLQLYFVSVITLHLINESRDSMVRNRKIKNTSITIMKVSTHSTISTRWVILSQLELNNLLRMDADAVEKQLLMTVPNSSTR